MSKVVLQGFVSTDSGLPKTFAVGDIISDTSLMSKSYVSMLEDMGIITDGEPGEDFEAKDLGVKEYNPIVGTVVNPAGDDNYPPENAVYNQSEVDSITNREDLKAYAEKLGVKIRGNLSLENGKKELARSVQ